HMVIGAFAFLFLGYFFLVKQKALFNWKTWIWIGLGLRLIFIASGPALSDDFYRFIWDGRVLIEGENPYLVLPHDYLESREDAFAKKLERDLYHGLNSKHYYTIYPPVNQCCFAIAAFLGDGNVKAELFYLRLIILLGEGALLFLLARILSILQRPREDLVWYALNPLVIVELSGNLHFEGMVLLFLAAALLYFIRGKWGASGVLFALAVGTKLLPLKLLPALIPILKQRTAG
ncbi:MAG: glycosyltransferase 87 family protein, partial [Flavobacteriales bacterium]|nr:glycosyltransferase 87 family protein [Flavobacteriales bacterium]